MEASPADQVPKKAVKALRARLQVVKKHLEPIFERPLSEIYTKLPLSERCELEILLTYSLNTLYYIYLRTQGSDPNKHDVMKELVRCQAYIKKIKKMQGKEDKPTMKVDKDAAARFVKAAIKEDKEAVEAEKLERKRKLEEEVSDSSSEDEVAPPPKKHSKKDNKKDKSAKKDESKKKNKKSKK